ncbi:hypothetical protein ACP70R_020738 [Stipagrostis hirtigluma subsp. patula]
MAAPRRRRTPRAMGSDGLQEGDALPRRPADDGHALPPDEKPRRHEQEQAAGGENTVRKLMRREMGCLRGRPDTALCAETFRRFRLQDEFFVHADDTYMMYLPRMRTSITSITAANDFIFAITCTGSCVAFCQTSNGSIAPYKRNGIRYFNQLDEKIEIVFYNKIDDSIIIVYSMRWRHDYQMRLHRLETLRSCNNWDSGVPVLGSRAKHLPLFDDCNNISIVSSSSDEYAKKVYELKSYKLVHSFDGQHICSIALSGGI